jgi:hypothetical protein
MRNCYYSIYLISSIIFIRGGGGKEEERFERAALLLVMPSKWLFYENKSPRSNKKKGGAKEGLYKRYNIIDEQYLRFLNHSSTYVSIFSISFLRRKRNI